MYHHAKSTLLVLLSLFLSTAALSAQDGEWSSAEDYPLIGVERSFSFAIDGKMYVGTGRIPQGSNTDRVFAYDPGENSWTELGAFPGGGLRNAFGFTAGGNGYVCGGYTGSTYVDDCWRYDVAEDSWTPIANYPGGELGFASTISTDSLAYVIFGGRGGSNIFTWEFFALDPSDDSWTQLEDFPGIGRWSGAAWLADGKIYAGGGLGQPQLALTDVYRYDIATDSWEDSPIAELPTEKASGGFTFVLDEKPYFCEGNNGVDAVIDYGNECFVYDANEDIWASAASYPGNPRILGVSEVIDGQAIIGLGINYGNNNYFNDVYTFSLPMDTVSSITEQLPQLPLQVFPNPVVGEQLTIQSELMLPANTSITIYDGLGRPLRVQVDQVANALPGVLRLNLGQLKPGLYRLEVNAPGQGRSTFNFVKQ